MSERRVSMLQRVYVVIVVTGLLAPLAIVCLMSFNESPFGTFPFSGTFQWYERLFSSGDALWSATGLSLQLALAVTVTCLLVGVPLSVWLVRFSRRWNKVLVNGLLVATVTVPWLVLAVSMLLVFNALGVGRSYLALFLGNLVIALPFTVFIVVTGLSNVDPALEEAAQSLGSSPVSAFLRVVVPAIAPSVGAGAIMAFLTCFNNFVVQYFLAPFGVQTLPLEIFGQIRVGYKPDINALATIITVFTLVPVFLAPKLLSKRGGKFSIGVMDGSRG